MEFPKLPGPGGQPRFPRRSDADSGDKREQGPYSGGFPTAKVDSGWMHTGTTKPVVLEDGWVEIHCYVRIEQAGPVAAAVRRAVPLGSQVEHRGVRRHPHTGAFTADPSVWLPVP